MKIKEVKHGHSTSLSEISELQFILWYERTQIMHCLVRVFSLSLLSFNFHKASSLSCRKDNKQGEIINAENETPELLNF